MGIWFWFVLLWGLGWYLWVCGSGGLMCCGIYGWWCLGGCFGVCVGFGLVTLCSWD